MTPDQIDQALEVWLPPPVASSVRTEWRWRPRDEHDREYRESYVASYNLDDGFDEEDASEAVRLLEQLNAQANRKDCAKALARLKVLTKERSQSDEDMTFQIALIADELSAYPLDVVRDACRFWADTTIFFPSWAELRHLCEERVLKRRCLLNALRRYYQRA